MSDKNKSSAILWYIFACLNLAVLGAIIRHLSSDLNIFLVIALLNALAFPVFIPWFLAVGAWFQPTKQVRMYTLRGIVGLITQMCWGYAISIVPLAYVTSINFTAPLFTVLLALLFFKEKISYNRITALIIGFLGVLVVARPFTESFHHAVFIVLIAALFRAIGNVIIKKLGAKDSEKVTMFYIVTSMAILSTPILFIFWQDLTINQWLWSALMGGNSCLFLLCLSHAYSKARLGTVMPFDFSTLVFVSVIAYFAFGERLDVWTIIGAVIILYGAIHSMRSEK